MGKQGRTFCCFEETARRASSEQNTLVIPAKTMFYDRGFCWRFATLEFHIPLPRRSAWPSINVFRPSSDFVRFGEHCGAQSSLMSMHNHSLNIGPSLHPFLPVHVKFGECPEHTTPASLHHTLLAPYFPSLAVLLKENTRPHGNTFLACVWVTQYPRTLVLNRITNRQGTVRRKT